MKKDEIQIYTTNSGTEIQITLDKESVWLNAQLIAHLFNVNRPAVVKHIQNINKSEELDEHSTRSVLEQVAADKKKRQMKLYNPDLINSVGYRVNSQAATQFRQWATKRLRDYLIHGYAINENYLKQKQQGFEYLEIIHRMKPKFAAEIFALPKDKSFANSIKPIMQSFDGINLYLSLEEKAATLKYLIFKNRSFVDGNKRIGASSFFHFLDKNKALFDKNKPPSISDDSLAALNIFVASGESDELEIVKKIHLQ